MGGGKRRNRNGVEIVSLCLGLEPKGFDNAVQDFARNARFQHSGLDAIEKANGARAQSRAGYNYFTKQSPVPPSNSKRRLVVLSGLANASSQIRWETLVNRDYFRGPADMEEIRVAINTIPPPAPAAALPEPGLSFASWAASHQVGEPHEDPDRDGLRNDFEFLAGLDPKSPNHAARDRLQCSSQTNGRLQLRYPRAMTARGISERLLVSDDLRQWNVLQVTDKSLVEVDADRQDVLLNLDQAPGQYFRLELSAE